MTSYGITAQRVARPAGPGAFLTPAPIRGLAIGLTLSALFWAGLIAIVA